MQLYHWDEVDAITDYTAGDVVVMAESFTQALEIVKEEGLAVWEECKSKACAVYEKPKAILIMCSP